MKTEIVKIYMLGTTDGYTHNFHNSRATRSPKEAEQYARRSGYNVVEEKYAVKVGNTYFQLATGNEYENPIPLTMGIDSMSDKEKTKKEALKKLSKKEKEVLGLI